MALSPHFFGTVTAERAQVTVSADGVRVVPGGDEAVDVLFGEHRVWSFNPARDARASGWTAWPSALKERLDGVVSWSVRRHAGAQVLACGELAFGSSRHRVAVVDDEGRPLAIDKAGRLARLFEQSDADERVLLADTLVRALDDLRGRGAAEAFLAYGCLLGAVRDGHVIGHDTDADLAVLCPSPYPVDVARQSFQLERLMRSLGWRTRRMSAGGFKIYLDVPGQRAVGTDVFSAWYDLDEMFHLMGSVRARVPMDSLLPVGSVVLEGREVVAPRDPVPLLAATYGAGWTVPDPAFHYDVPPPTTQRLTGWLRGERRRLRFWDSFYADHDASRRHPSTLDPSDFARWVLPRLTPEADLVDLGCGAGRDALWFGEQGRAVQALDYSSVAVEQGRAHARRRDLGTVTFEHLNLYDLRQLLRSGAALAARSRPVDVYARGVADSLAPGVRTDLWRFLDMAGRSGGRSFVETRSRGRRTLGRLLDEVDERRGRVVEHHAARGLAADGDEDATVLRLVIEWGAR